MGHRNARLTERGRRLLVERVRHLGQPVAHVAKAMGISRQCAHRWLKRWDLEGDAGLADRSSRPHTIANQTPPDTEALVVAARLDLRCGPDRLAPAVGVPARTITRILRRHDLPLLRDCDPLTGEVIRSSKTTAVRYEREIAGDLLHMDVKKIGRIPDGGGWRAHGREMGSTAERKRTRVGYDFVHSIVDDHSRVAYSEIHDDEKAVTCAGFFARALEFFAAHGVTQVRQVMTDNHWSYTRSNALAALMAEAGIEHITIRPHCPWQNGKVERFNRTLQIQWAYRQVFVSNQDRCDALAPWLEFYNTERRHSALRGRAPITRLPSPTS